MQFRFNLPGCLASLTIFLAALPNSAKAFDTTVRLGGGFEIKPYGLYQLDQGSFSNSRPGGQGAGFNGRRLRTGARLKYNDDVEVGFIWDFGHSPGGQGKLFEAKIAYTGLKPFTFTGGVFHVNNGLESTMGVGNLLFLERASISTITRNIAGGIDREAIQAEAHGDRYLLAAALTAGQGGPGRDGDQRAVIARAAGLPVKTDSMLLHVGVSGEYVFRPARDAGKLPATSLSDQPEFSIDPVPSPLSTGSVETRNIGVVGPELGFAAGRLWLQGEWYSILLDRRENAGGGTLNFSGWYAQAGYTILGTPRQYSAKDGVWGVPKPAESFDPRAGNFGAVEVGARYSTVDLNSSDVRGGVQRIWTAGVNWWPVEPIRFSLQYEHADIDGGRSPRSIDIVAGRAQLQF